MADAEPPRRPLAMDRWRKRADPFGAVADWIDGRLRRLPFGNVLAAAFRVVVVVVFLAILAACVAQFFMGGPPVPPATPGR